MSLMDEKRTAPAAAVEAVQVTTENRVEQVIRLVREQGGVAVLIVVFVAASIFSSGFFDVGNLESILVGNAYVSLLALGMTFVIISGGIDLSVGSVFALGGVLAAYGVNHGGGVVALVLPIGVAAVWGLVQGLLIAKARLAPFIVTLAGMLGARGLLQAITDEGSKTYTVPTGSWFIRLGDGTWVPIITVIVLFVLGAVALLRTRYGQSLFAIGGNESAAVLMGLPVLRNKILVYVLSSTLAGTAGALNASRLQSGVTQHRRGLRAHRDRRRDHRRHTAHRRRGLDQRHRRRCAAAGDHAEPDRRAPVEVRLVGLRRGQRAASSPSSSSCRRCSPGPSE